MLVVDSFGNSRGLALLCKFGWLVDIQSFLRHHIDSVISNQQHNHIWRLASIYGHPNSTKGREFGTFSSILTVFLFFFGYVWVT